MSGERRLRGRRAAHLVRVLALAGAAACASGGNRPAPEVAPRPLATSAASVAAPDSGERAPAGAPAEVAAEASAPAAAATAPSGREESARDAAGKASADGAAPATSEVPSGPRSGTSAASQEGPRSGRPAGQPAEPKPGAEVLVATVAGTRIELEQLLSAWLRRDGSGMRALLDDLVLSRIVELEAARLGAELPANLLRRTVERRRAVLAEEAQRAGEPDLDRFIERRLGLEPARYFAGLEREVAIDLLASRVVRAWLLTNERAEVRVISVKSTEARDRVQAKLAAGQPFAEVAAELSEDPSKEEGGRMAPVVRGETVLAQLAFATAAGESTGPIEDRGRFLFLAVDAFPRVASGTWATYGAEVEASLAERGIEDPEYWQWQQAMQEVYEVDLEPFRALLGSKP